MTILELFNLLNNDGENIHLDIDLIKKENKNCINDLLGLILGKMLSDIINDNKNNKKYVDLNCIECTNDIDEYLYYNKDCIKLLVNKGYNICYIHIENDEDYSYCYINMNGREINTEDMNTELSDECINLITKLIHKDFNSLDYDYINCFIDVEI